MIVDPELLRELLEYNPETGDLFWKRRTEHNSSSAASSEMFNKRYAGSPAFTHTNKCGYRRGSIFKKLYSAHRVAWAIFYGEYVDEIDHIDGDRSNNRISNLRSVTRSENCRNRGVRSDNTSGRVGVYWHIHANKWRARITVHGKETRLGSFETFEDAVRAREEAERVMGFHENHGARMAYGVTPDQLMNRDDSASPRQRRTA